MSLAQSRYGDIEFEELQRLSLEEIEFPRVLELVAAHAMSERGRERILALSPMMDGEELGLEHARVDEMLSLVQHVDEVPLERVEDISPLLQKSRVNGAYLLAPQLLDVCDVVQSARRIRTYLSARSTEVPHLHALCSGISEYRMLEKHINDAVDRGGAVRDNATRELQNIRHEIFQTSARLRSRLNKIVSKMSDEELLQDEYLTQRDGRFVIPLKTSSKRAIPGIIHGVSASGSTVFMEPAEVFEMNNELSLLFNEEQREIVRILTTLTAEIGAVADDLELMVSVLEHLDSLHAKASYASSAGGIRPRIVEEHECELHKVFHPILLHSNGRERVVPLSIRFDERQRGHLISGPNAGGKSVALKSIGLNIAMALSGIFPLGDCLCSPRHILVAIGDHQSIESNLSTFSSQILRLRQILSHSAYDSLILVDEICSGTDPTEGSALAAGILDSFIEQRAFFVVTTHQSSLKSYALSHQHIANASLEFDLDKLVPTYAFLNGVPGNSYAFELANSVNLPHTVLERAKSYLGDRHGELEQSIIALQRYKQEAEDLRRKTYIELSEAEKKRKEYEAKFSDFKAKYQKLMIAAQQEASEVLRTAKSTVEKALREAREQQRSPKEIHSDLEKLRSEIAHNVEHLLPRDRNQHGQKFSAGDHVSMRNSEQRGVIQVIEDHKAVVEFNGITFRVDLDELKRTAAPAEKQRRSASAAPLKLDASMTADVRGMRAGEAIMNVDTALNNALLANLPYLNIIHGKGTGALRQAIHEFLKEQHHIKSFRLGELGEGDAGVTIVELT